MIQRGILFGDIHTFNDLNLILSGCSIPPAEPKTNFVDIPGGDGTLDLTEAHGEVKYNDRECEFSFTVNPSDGMTYEEKKTQVSNALNGLRCNITLDIDDNYYYVGRVIVDDWQKEKKLKKITVKAIVKPYKLKQNETVVSVKLTGGEQTVSLYNSKKSVVPSIEISDDNTILTWGGTPLTLSAGSYRILDICLVHGENQVTLSGSGTVTFTYQEGDL